MRWWRRKNPQPEPAGTPSAPPLEDQSVRDAVVIGDVIMVSATGDVRISTEQRRYHLAPFGPPPAGLSADRARRQPSRLLLPRHRVVPFSGRDGELRSLRDWFDEPDPVAVRLVHGPGGQGKTRLAQHFAEQAADRHVVWHALHSPAPGSPSPLPVPGGGRILVLVDYADRWPAADLYALVTDLVNVGRHTGATVRVLLLARSAGSWWSAVRTRVDGDLDVAVDAQALTPLATGQPYREELFRSARDRFAQVMDIPAAGIGPPADLSTAAFAQVLSVHMAALVAVDAARHGIDPPAAGEHRLSEYLLHRERAYWHDLHHRPVEPLVATPAELGRTVYVATLTGALTPAVAGTALSRARVSGTDVTRLIADHASCYPPEDPGTVLEALHPDRLGEDFLALLTPGAAGSADIPADAWAAEAPGRLLGGDDQPPWTGSAVAVLVETARRWPHVAERLLGPLMRAHPEMLLTGGTAAVARFAEIPWLDHEALAAATAALDQANLPDLAEAAAAISGRLLASTLTRGPDDLDLSLAYARHGDRLGAAGQFAYALAAYEQAAERIAVVSESDPRREIRYARVQLSMAQALLHLGRAEESLVWAREAGTTATASIDRTGEGLGEYLRSLNAEGSALEMAGRHAEALRPTRTASLILEREAPRHFADWTAALRRETTLLTRLGRVAEAVDPAEAAVGAARRFGDQAELAKALQTLSNTYRAAGRRPDAANAMAQATGTYRVLAANQPRTYQPRLANALKVHSDLLSELGRNDEALACAEEAVGLLRELADRTPTSRLLQRLADALSTLSTIQRRLEGPSAGLGPTSESLDLRQQAFDMSYKRDKPIAGTDPADADAARAEQLRAEGRRLFEAGRSADATARLAEAVQLLRPLVPADPGRFRQALIDFLAEYLRCLVASGPTLEVFDIARESVALARIAAEEDPLVGTLDLVGALQLYASMNSIVPGQDLRGAVAAAAEAVRLSRHYAELMPEQYAEALARQRQVLAAAQEQLGDQLLD
jgi:tetratricopeptide (TPR) repeat protein